MDWNLVGNIAGKPIKHLLEDGVHLIGRAEIRTAYACSDLRRRAIPNRVFPDLWEYGWAL